MTLNSDAKLEYTLTLWFQKWYEELSELSMDHPKISKTVHWWALFVQSISIHCQLENLGGIVMTLKGVAKFKRKLTCRLKNDIKNLVNFHVSSWKSENVHFDWIHLSKAFKYLDEKEQKSYVSWHWRVMQSLKKTDSCFQKRHEEFGEF